FAPFLPFASEEVWSWWQAGSIHTAAWPRPEELFEAAGGERDEDVRALELAAAVLGEIRKRKSEEQRPMKTPVVRAAVRAPEEDRLLIESARKDLCAVALIQDLVIERGDVFGVDVELAAPEPSPQERGA
ncbi:MAG TPA: class I tRNA ligase family protein, partial [Vicinamibacterales bacterium]|nr:class I tRNA ligase family protein [Vicinamibacterales bacterium]